jgi:hypothetical protein
MRWLPEAIGIVGFLTNVWANLLIARKSESGWIVRLVSNVLWLVFGLAQASLANTLNAVAFAGINVYGLCRWRRERLMRKTTCDDHHRILCRWCRQIVRQCRCCPGSDKPTSLDGVCGACVTQLPPMDYASKLVGPASNRLEDIFAGRLELTAVELAFISHLISEWYMSGGDLPRTGGNRLAFLQKIRAKFHALNLEKMVSPDGTRLVSVEEHETSVAKLLEIEGSAVCPQAVAPSENQRLRLEEANQRRKVEISQFAETTRQSFTSYLQAVCDLRAVEPPTIKDFVSELDPCPGQDVMTEADRVDRIIALERWAHFDALVECDGCKE